MKNNKMAKSAKVTALALSSMILGAANADAKMIDAAKMFSFNPLGSGYELRNSILKKSNNAIDLVCAELACGAKGTSTEEKKDAKPAVKKDDKTKSKEAKCGEGKCGEGKCGGKSKDSKESKDKKDTKTNTKEDKSKTKEAKCGEKKQV